MKRPSRRVNTRRNRLRRLRIESLELRRLLASDLREASQGHMTEMEVAPFYAVTEVNTLAPMNASSLVGEGDGPGGPGGGGGPGSETWEEEETLTAEQVFPVIVLPDPLQDEVDFNSPWASRSTIGGGGGPAAPNPDPGTPPGGGTPGGGTPGIPGVITIFLRNDMTGSEGDTQNFVVAASAPVPHDIVVDLTYEPIGTYGATAVADYTPQATATLKAFSSFVNVPIPFKRDGVWENTETFRVKISGVRTPASVAVRDPYSQVIGTIRNVDTPPDNNPRVRELSIRNALGTEGVNSHLTFTVTASNESPTHVPVTVHYKTVQRSALSNVDYVYTEGDLTFAPTQTEATILVPLIDDTIIETSEYFEVVLSNPSAYSVIRQGTGVGTIYDNDLPVKVSVDNAPIVREGNTSKFRVWVNTNTRNVSGYLRTASGSATENVDYQGGDYYFSIPAGQYETTVSVTTYANDDPPEADIENYTGQLINVVNATVAQGTATGTIKEYKVPLSITAYTNAVEGNTTPNYFYVVFSVPSDFENTISVGYNTVDGTASSITDYVANSGTITFTKGIIDPYTNNDYQKMVTIETRPDLVPEIPNTEYFTFVLGTPTNATLTPSTQTYTMTIRDDDDVPVLSIEDAQAEEGNNLSFVLKLNKLPASGTASVTLNTVDGSAKDGVGETPADYNPISSSTFNLTQLTTTVTVQSYNDALVEDSETFQLVATNPSNIYLGRSTATGTILDNDSLIELSIDDAAQTEGDNGWTNPNKLRFNISLTRKGKAVPNPIGVGYTTSEVNSTLSGGAPNPEYATPYVDYLPTSGTLTIAPGASSGYFEVDINGDWIPEANEKLKGLITGASLLPTTPPTSSNGTVNFVVKRTEALGTIIDDDKDKPAKLDFDFQRILDEDQNCICTTADGPSMALTSTKDGSLTVRPEGVELDGILELRKGGNDSLSQLQTFLLQRKDGTDVPDTYTVKMTVGGFEHPTTTFAGISGDAQRKSVVSIPLDLTNYSTGFYNGTVEFEAKKAVTGGTLSLKVKRDYRFKVVNNSQASEYTPDWWNPNVERLYPLKTYGTGNLSSPSFSAGALYVRGDQTGWWFEGSSFAAPDGLFAALRKLPNNDYELRYKQGDLRIFSPQGILKQAIDRNGNITQYTFTSADSDGVADELSTITDPLGRTTTYAYSGGLLTQVTDFAGRVTTFTVSSNKLTKITAPDPDGAGPRVAPYYDFVYSFTTTGGYITMTDAESEQTKYTFNRFGRVTRIDLPDGGNWQYQYLKDKATVFNLPGGGSSGVAVMPGEMESITTNPRGYKTRYNTDRFGLPIKIVYADGSTETFERNKHGQPLSHSYPAPDGTAATATYTYDAKQDLTLLVSPEVGQIAWEYDTVYSLPTKITATGKPQQVITRDAKGNVTQVTTKALNTTVGIAANPVNGGPAAAVNTNPIDRYDANNDGLVNSKDFDLIAEFYGVMAERGYDERPIYLDVNNDGVVGSMDALAVSNYMNATTTKELVESYSYSTGSDGLPKGMLTSYTDANGQAVNLEYYPTSAGATKGMLKRTYLVDGATTYDLQTLTYDAYLNVNASTDLYGRTTQLVWDALDLLTQVKEPAADGVNANRPITQYGYSTMGHVTQIVDPAGQITNVSRNVPGRQMQVTQVAPSGGTDRTFAMGWDAMGNVTSQTDSLGRVTAYEYDNLDRTTRIIYPTVTNGGNGGVDYTYNTASYVTSVKDVLGTITSYTYSQAGDLTKVSVPNPANPSAPIETSYAYASPGVLASTTNALGRTDTYVTDNFGRLASIRLPAQGPYGETPKVTFAYDKAGRSLAGTDLAGTFSLTTLDKLGRVQKQESIDPDRTGTANRPTITWAAPQVVSNTITQNITLADGRVVKTTSDMRDRLIGVEMPKLNGDSGTISGSFQYDILDRTTSRTNFQGATTQYTYDRFNQLKTMLGANPSTGVADSAYTTSFSYDNAGRPTSVVAPNGATTSYGYDVWDRTTSVTEPDPDGAGALAAMVTNWTYNLTARTVTQSGSDGRTTTTSFDPLGRTISKTNVDGGTTQYAYDAASQLKQLTDPLNNVTKWTYDAMGNTIQEEQVGIGSRYWYYGITGQLTGFADRTGNSVNWTYNFAQQPLTESWSATNGNSAKTITYEYDTLSRLKKMSANAQDKVEWTYNTAGLVTNEKTTMPIVGGATSATEIVSSMNYSYDIYGRNTGKQQIVDSTTHTTDVLSYDKRDRLNSIVRTGATSVENMWSTVQYNVLDQITGTQRGSGTTAGSNTEVTQAITRDSVGRPTQIAYTNGSGSSLESYSMQYASASNRLASLTTPSGTTAYTYTSGGQLASAGSVNYVYDANGNPTSRGGQTSIIGTFNRLLDDGTYTYQYDAEGRTTQRTNKSTNETEKYVWNQISQLTKIDVLSSPSATTPTKTVSYGYDPTGRRSSVKQAAGGPSGTVIDYLLSDGDQVAEILGNNSQVTNRFLYGPDVDMVLSEQQFSSGMAQNPMWQLTDHLGTVRGIAQKPSGGGNATVVNSLQYDAFGKITSQTNSANQPQFGFAGRDIEPVGDMTHNRARYYGTSSGRFITTDPISFAAGDSNLYRYTGNQPTTHRDPDGLMAVSGSWTDWVNPFKWADWLLEPEKRGREAGAVLENGRNSKLTKQEKEEAIKKWSEIQNQTLAEHDGTDSPTTWGTAERITQGLRNAQYGVEGIAIAGINFYAVASNLVGGASRATGYGDDLLDDLGRPVAKEIADSPLPLSRFSPKLVDDELDKLIDAYIDSGKSKVFVVGEGQKRIGKYVRDKLNKDGLEFREVWPSNMRFKPNKATGRLSPGDEQTLLEFNMYLIKRLHEKGFKFIDIGRDGRAPRSLFYEAELAMLDILKAEVCNP